VTVWPEERMVTADDFHTVDMTINVGPQHPATHGVFRMVLTVDGEMVVDCEPYIGYLHRGLEKLTENHDYRQSMGWWDRTDYLAGMACEMAYCMAVEKLGQFAVPERAEYIRVMMVELSRILSHMMFFGAFGADVGSFGTSFIYAWRERERIYDFFEKWRATGCSRRTSAPAAFRWTCRRTTRTACAGCSGRSARAWRTSTGC